MIRFLAAGALVLLFSGAAIGGERSLGLRQAIELALENNSLLQAAHYEQSAAEAGVAMSRSRYLPKITFEERAGITNSPTKAFMMRLDEGRFSLAGDLNHPPTTGDFQTSLSLEQPLFDVGIAREKAVAEQENVSRSHAFEQRRQEVAFQVYGAYLAVQRARAYVSVVEKAVADAREHQRLAAVRNAAGVGLKFDELRIGTFLAEIEQQKITAVNDLALARLRLGQVIGLPAGTAPDIADTVTAQEVSLGGKELVESALSGRKDLQELEAQLAKSEAGVSLARGSYWPTIYAGASYQMNDRDVPLGRDNDSWILGANLRWELFDGLRRSNEVSRAQAGRNAVGAYLAERRRDVALQVNEAMLRREEAIKRLDVAQRAVKDAEEMVRLVNKRYENALATTVETLDAQTALNRARAQLVDNEAGYALANARVYHSAGLFLKEVVR